MSKPTYIQHVALGKLINGTTYGHPIAARTMAVLEREGWVRDGAVTHSGRLAWWDASNPETRGPRPVQPSPGWPAMAPTPSKPHECDEDCYLGYCDQMVYPEPQSIAHTAYARTGVYLGDLRDV